MTETHLFDLIVAIYDAAVEPSLWPVSLERYAEAVSADIVALKVHNFSRRRSEIQAVFGMTTPFKQSYNEHYSVKRGLMVRNVRGLGTLVPEEIRWVPAVTNGRVERRLVQPGAVVRADTVVLELSNPQLEQETLNA